LPASEERCAELSVFLKRQNKNAHSVVFVFIQRVFAIKMKRQITLISNYLGNHNKPTFKHFTKTNEKEIEDISVKLPPNDTAISLERAWSKAYNNTAIIKRPEKPLAES
jgi:hypothetical protein